MKNTEEKFKVMGVNSEADFCECCGKTDVSKVVWVKNNETGEVNHYGTTCAQKRFNRKEVKKMVSYSEAKEQYCRVNSWENGGVNKERYEYYFNTYPSPEMMSR